LEADFDQVMNIILHGNKNREFGLKKDKMDLRPIMRRFLSPLLFITFVLGACSSSLSPAESIPAPPTVTDAPTSFPAFGECGYQWAYDNLPELSEQFDRTVKNLIPESASHATAFGENCIGADGQVIRFLAMQTDFYVIAKVETLDDHETFGNWIAEVMRVVDEIPPEMLAGPSPGYVEFRFENDAMESIALRIPIREYREIATGLTGEELFRMFYRAP
jgi:hypothetical protein